MENRTYEKFLPTSACSVCKGACCRSMGGSYSPSDFRAVCYESIRSLLEEGKTSIDWWETFNPRYFIGKKLSEDPIIPVFYLRARNQGSSIVDPGVRGTCCHLGEDGCELDRKHMPLQCRTLKPGDAENPCMNDYDKMACVDEWRKHQDVLAALALEFDPTMFDSAHRCFMHEDH